MPPMTQNDMIGLAELFRLAAKNPQPFPGHVQVLLSVADCERLAMLLDRSTAH